MHVYERTQLARCIAGIVPPAQVMRIVRNGNVFNITANSVTFHRDHFEVEDDDGFNLEYDYEI